MSLICLSLNAPARDDEVPRHPPVVEALEDGVGSDLLLSDACKVSSLVSAFEEFERDAGCHRRCWTSHTSKQTTRIATTMEPIVM
jgi:hypothetical protein